MGDERRRLRLRDLTRRTAGLRPALIQIFLLAIALEVFALAAPIFNQLLIDEVPVSSDREYLYVLAMGFALLLVIQTAIEVLRSWIVLRVSADVRLQWLSGLFAHRLRLPASFFENRNDSCWILGCHGCRLGCGLRCRKVDEWRECW